MSRTRCDTPYHLSKISFVVVLNMYIKKVRVRVRVRVSVRVRDRVRG